MGRWLRSSLGDGIFKCYKMLGQSVKLATAYLEAGGPTGRGGPQRRRAYPRRWRGGDAPSPGPGPCGPDPQPPRDPPAPHASHARSPTRGACPPPGLRRPCRADRCLGGHLHAAVAPCRTNPAAALGDDGVHVGVVVIRSCPKRYCRVRVVMPRYKQLTEQVYRNTCGVTGLAIPARFATRFTLCSIWRAVMPKLSCIV
jgi:hypothetical protein